MGQAERVGRLDSGAGTSGAGGVGGAGTEDKRRRTDGRELCWARIEAQPADTLVAGALAGR